LGLCLFYGRLGKGKGRFFELKDRIYYYREDADR